jgi:protein-L-isoaspartate O-methyltransferase
MLSVDNRTTFSGPRLTGEDARQQLEKLGFVLATRLLPYNIGTILDLPDGPSVVRRHFGQPFHNQAISLAEALKACNVFNDAILSSVHRTPRQMLVPGSRSPIAYWNGVNTIEGTAALTPPWLTAYAAHRLSLSPGKRVLVLGYGFGYASLVFSNIVGPDGEVVALELDPHLVDLGQELLSYLHIKNITLLRGDALRLPSSLGQFDAIWPTLSVRKVPESWTAAIKTTGTSAAFVPLSEEEFSSRQELRKGATSYSDYLQGNWWLNLRLLFARGTNGDRQPEFGMYELFNPPMSEEGHEDVDVSVWYQSTLEMETRLLRLLAN